MATRCTSQGPYFSLMFFVFFLNSFSSFPPPPRCLWNSISVMTDIKNHQARGKSSLPSFHRTLNPSSQLSFFIFKFSLLFSPRHPEEKEKKIYIRRVMLSGRSWVFLPATSGRKIEGAHVHPVDRRTRPRRMGTREWLLERRNVGRGKRGRGNEEKWEDKLEFNPREEIIVTVYNAPEVLLWAEILHTIADSSLSARTCRLLPRGALLEWHGRFRTWKREIYIRKEHSTERERLVERCGRENWLHVNIKNVNIRKCGKDKKWKLTITRITK